MKGRRLPVACLVAWFVPAVCYVGAVMGVPIA